MWEIDVTNQIATFGLSLCLGTLLCVVYDIIRAWRQAGFNSFAAVFFTDILFWIFSAFVTFIFLISRTNGEIRGYALFGALLGFVLFRVSLSRLLFAVLSFIFIWIIKIKNIICKKIYLFYEKFEQIISKILQSSIKNLKRAAKSVKKLLKKGSRLLYTDKNNASTENVLNETKTEA